MHRSQTRHSRCKPRSGGSLRAKDLAAGEIRQGPRAYGTIDNDGPQFIGTHPGLVSVTMPQTGIYCIVPAAGVPSVNAHAQATVEWFDSTGVDLLVQVSSEPSNCTPGNLAVLTWAINNSGGVDASSGAAFTLLVP